MMVIERLPAAQIQLRSPPAMVTTAARTAAHNTNTSRASSRSALLCLAALQDADDRLSCVQRPLRKRITHSFPPFTNLLLERGSFISTRMLAGSGGIVT
jgi:hypothetical protein